MTGSNSASTRRPGAPAAPPAAEGADLPRLLAEIRACRLCRDAPPADARGRTAPPLPHEPRPILRATATARLCIASQAPGIRAHDAGVPFRDPSGVRLRAWLGLAEEDFYDESRLAIVPMGFCFPGWDAAGGDLPPRRECAPRFRAPIFAALPGLELVLAIGLYAQAWHLGPEAKDGLTETVARWREVLASPRRPRVLPLPHPSWRNNTWLKKHPWFEAELLPELRREVAALMGTQPPG